MSGPVLSAIQGSGLMEAIMKSSIPGERIFLLITIRLGILPVLKSLMIFSQHIEGKLNRCYLRVR